MSGQRDFNIFLRQGGKDAEILKNQFADFVKNQQLLEFFQGRGAGIQIQENIGQRDFTPIRAESQFELEKARVGLKDSTNQNKIAVEQNTVAIKDLINNFNQGLRIEGLDVQRVLDFFERQQVRQPQNNILQSAISAGKTGFIQQSSKLDITVSVDGRDLQFQGSPETIRALAIQVSQEVAQAVENKLVDDLNKNDNTPISKATDGRTEKF